LEVTTTTQPMTPVPTTSKPTTQAVRAVRRPVAPPVLATLAALGSIGEAVAHVPVIEPHLVEAPYLGVGFVLLTVVGFYLAVRLVVDPDELVWSATGVVAVLAVLGYVLSRTVGLPQIGDDVGAWADPLGLTAVSCELLMVVAAGGHFLRPARR
jgi:hypothetical protein